MPMTSLGLLAQFDTGDELTAAARAAREAGYTHLEAYAPYPMEDTAKALGYHRSGVAFLVLLGGLLGAGAAFLMMLWISAVAYRLNVGGKPPDSWPMFIPVTFELGVLTASLSGFLGVLILCKLPRYHHPLFETPLFARATTDGFYLFLAASDPIFDREQARHFFSSQDSAAIEEVAS